MNCDGVELACAHEEFAAFSLTPALSRWERENCRQRWMNPICPVCKHEFIDSIPIPLTSIPLTSLRFSLIFIVHFPSRLFACRIIHSSFFGRESAPNTSGTPLK